MPIYLTGDATNPREPGTKLICHCVNDVGSWGKGFVRCLRKWPWVEQAYRNWAALKWSPREVPRTPAPDSDEGIAFALGAVQFVQVRRDLWVANIVGQHRTTQHGELVPIRYEALERGFVAVRAFCERHQASVHMPRMGAGLAKGAWPQIAEIIDRALVERAISATVYDLV